MSSYPNGTSQRRLFGVDYRGISHKGHTLISYWVPDFMDLQHNDSVYYYAWINDKGVVLDRLNMFLESKELSKILDEHLSGIRNKKLEGAING